MKTQCLRWQQGDAFERREIIQRAARALKQGNVVAYPTETVYGLGALGLDEQAAGEIFRIKRRPWDRPLLLAVTGIEMVSEVASVLPDLARDLMDRFWPGPLSLVLPRSHRVPDVVTAGGDTVGVRCPAHEAARALLNAVGTPITSPSANITGRPSPTDCSAVMAELKGHISYVIDGGRLEKMEPSTLIDLSGRRPVLLRAGALDIADVERITGPLRIEEGEDELNCPLRKRQEERF